MHSINVRDKNILLLSDTHGKHRLVRVPESTDIIIHCGDICNDGNTDEIADFFRWYSALNIPDKIFVNGNHDLPFELEPEQGEQLVPGNVHWLHDDLITINDIRIKSVSPFSCIQNFDTNHEVDILVSHAPPSGILDDGIGMYVLKEYALKIKPQYYVFGHNHSGYGRMTYQKIQFINASIYHELESRKQ